jgi:hypothetical protein
MEYDKTLPPIFRFGGSYRIVNKNNFSALLCPQSRRFGR